MSDMNQSNQASDAAKPTAPATVQDATAPQIEPIGENELALTKNGKRYVFECPPGSEAQTLNQIAEMVTRNNSDLTWFDAAVLSHQLGERMSKRLSAMGAQRLSA